jgi:hypothetical protein
VGSARMRGGYLSIDLTNVEMSGDEMRTLVSALQATVVTHLARVSAESRVVTISLLPGNNGFRPEPEPEPPPPGTAVR